jgi:hypothetical protein
LYALRPDAFAAARDEQVRQAKAARQQPLARELGRLRRPTQSAWLVNLLWRDQREVMQQLFELAGELGRAQAQASGSELRSLTAQRREVESALIRRARTLGNAAGVNVTDAMVRDVQDTLAAALAQPAVADEVRGGRLVKPLAYAGFGPLVTPAPGVGGHGTAPGVGGHGTAPGVGDHGTAPGVGDRGTAGAPAADRPAAPPRQLKDDIAQLRAAQQARERRVAAERQLQEAHTASDAAAGVLAEVAQAAETAYDRQMALERQVAGLRAQLQALEEQLATAEQVAQRAARRKDQAQQAHQTALEALQRAEGDLKRA